MGRYPLKLYTYLPNPDLWEHSLLTLVAGRKVKLGHVSIAVGQALYHIHTEGVRICKEEAVHKKLKWHECLTLDYIEMPEADTLKSFVNEDYKQSSVFYITFWYLFGKHLGFKMPTLCSTETCVILQKFGYNIPVLFTGEEIKEWLHENHCILGTSRRRENDDCS